MYGRNFDEVSIQFNFSNFKVIINIVFDMNMSTHFLEFTKF